MTDITAALPPTVRVELDVAPPPAQVGRGTELLGLAVVLVEMGLSDLPGVVPVVAGVPPSPGLSEALSTAERWNGVISLSPGSELHLELCDADACEGMTVPVALDTAHQAAATLLDAASDWLGRPAAVAVSTGWRQPVSKDPYAVLLTGRGAAVLYGLREPASDDALGDRRRDPVDRAVYVDPLSAPAAWVLSRRDAERGEPSRARGVLPRAMGARPTSTVLYADDAALADLAARPIVARRAWLDVLDRAPLDPRYVVPAAWSALRAGEIDDAAHALDALPDWAQGEARVVELRVALADAAVDAEATDELLARWQEAAPTDPRPVERRIRAFVRSQDYAAASGLLEEWRTRGASAEADRLAVPLHLALGDAAEAAALARKLGLDDAAVRIEARRDGDPSRLAPDLWEARLLRAEQALARDAPDEALGLIGRDQSPEALALRVRAHEIAGREKQAEAARAELRWRDPSAAGGL